MEIDMNYKNRKPKSYKGCCGMCCLKDSDGRRNGRKLTIQELRVKQKDRYVEESPRLSKSFEDE